MPKSLSCKDVGVDCDFQATGETVEEVMRQTAAHAHSVHGMTEIPAEMVAKVQAAIKDV
jgi:predicted small metal-binding protein